MLGAPVCVGAIVRYRIKNIGSAATAGRYRISTSVNGDQVSEALPLSAEFDVNESSEPPVRIGPAALPS